MLLNTKLQEIIILFLRFYFLGDLMMKKNFLMIPDIASIFKTNHIKDVKFVIVGLNHKKILTN